MAATAQLLRLQARWQVVVCVSRTRTTPCVWWWSAWPGLGCGGCWWLIAPHAGCRGWCLCLMWLPTSSCEQQQQHSWALLPSVATAVAARHAHSWEHVVAAPPVTGVVQCGWRVLQCLAVWTAATWCFPWVCQWQGHLVSRGVQCLSVTVCWVVAGVLHLPGVCACVHPLRGGDAAAAAVAAGWLGPDTQTHTHEEVTVWCIWWPITFVTAAADAGAAPSCAPASCCFGLVLAWQGSVWCPGTAHMPHCCCPVPQLLGGLRGCAGQRWG